jgi:threonine dehydratase
MPEAIRGRAGRAPRGSRLLTFPSERRSREEAELNQEQIRQAAARIGPFVRRTPILQAWIRPLVGGPLRSVRFKLENLQVGGQVDVRGALNFALSLPEEQRARGVVTTSWGGIGSALAYAGERLGFPAIVFLSGPAVTREKMVLLEQWGACVMVKGTSWANTQRSARQFAEKTGMAYLDPIAEPAVIAGQATAAMEVLEDVPDLAVLLVSGDGGGLSVTAGALAAKTTRPAVRVIGVELDRVARLHHCLQIGRLSDFPTDPRYLGPPRVARLCFDMVRRYVDEMVRVTDDERQKALNTLWGELEISAGPFGATAATAVLWGRVTIPEKGSLLAIVGSSGEEGLF